MIKAVKLETPEDKTFRLLQRVPRQTITKVVSEFHVKSQALRFLCKNEELSACFTKAYSLKAAANTPEGLKAYEAEFQAAWAYRSQLQKNNVDPPAYEDALEERIWQYGWTLQEFKEIK